MFESSFLQAVNEAKSRIKECKMSAVKEMLANDKMDGILIDVREQYEYQQNHIPGAINISRGVLEANIKAEVSNKKQKIYLYCSGGVRSALSADSLQNLGYKDVISISDGFAAW